MDVKGGGLAHYELGNMKYMRLTYGEGLRVPKMQNRAWDREKYFYQKSGYCRGYIWHHRSNATQQWLFHFLYGGAGKFFVQRWVVDFGFRIWVRLAWLPFTVHFIGSMLGQREYDAKEKSLNKATASKANPNLKGFGQGEKGVFKAPEPRKGG